jgi:two-component system, NtrC family, sensor histidine kinase HydH
VKIRPLSLSRTFALLSFLIIALITASQVFLQWHLLRDDLLRWERTVTADTIRGDAAALLRPEDFARWRSPEAQQRFESVFRVALMRLEISRIKVYDPEMRVIWSDEPRLLGMRFPENTDLVEALQGETVAHLETNQVKAENVFERQFAETVEMYVPLWFSGDGKPSGGRVVGVVEIYKNPSRALASLSRDRWAIALTSLAGAFLLYAVLFGIVHRASRQLQSQRENLERQTHALRTANEELRAMQDQLRASERLAAIGEVSAAVAHGIRNPLANIRAAAQVALDCPGERGVVEQYLGAIMAEVDRLSHWLRSLLDSIRPFQLRAAPTNLNILIEDALGLLDDAIRKSAVKVERELDPGVPTISADEVQLRQAFLGVFENAVEAMPPGGTLKVSTRSVSDDGRREVHVRIADNGPGIPPEHLARIFEPFYTTKRSGTGLGLAITRKVIEGHRGQVRVTSEPGAGTTFEISLPERTENT